MKKLLIMEKNNLIEILRYDFGEITNYKVYSTNNLSLVGNIYLGRITKIIKGSFAFINIGEDKNGFLDINDFKERHLYRDDKLNIKESDLILVQVVKDGNNIKGPTLTTEINIGTKNLVLLYKPKKTISFSKKFFDDDKKSQFKKLAKNFEYSVIFRSDSVLADQNDINNEYEESSLLLDNIIEESSFHNQIKLLYSMDNIKKEIKNLSLGTDIVITSSKKLYDKYKERYNIEYKDSIDLFSTEMILSKVEEFYKKKVWLRSGGFIIIEETESCVVIDVNSGKNSKSRDKETMILKTNSDAATEILRQIKFRNLSGIILIDFIDMHNTDNRDIILDRMIEKSKNDYQPIKVYGFTALGLMELTRKRNNLSISKVPNNYRVRRVNNE